MKSYGFAIIDYQPGLPVIIKSFGGQDGSGIYLTGHDTNDLKPNFAKKFKIQILKILTCNFE